MKKWLDTSFPFYYNNQKQNFFLCIGTSLFTLFFLLLFKPFPEVNSSNTIVDFVIITLVLFVTLIFNINILPILFPAFFDFNKWNLKKYILFNCWLLIIVSISISLTSYFFINGCNSILESILFTTFQVIVIGVFPLFGITFLIRNKMLSENLKNAITANQNIKSIAEKKKIVEINNSITIKTDTSETLSIKYNEFIYAEAQDNYSMIYYVINDKFQKKLLRITLKNLENQLSNKMIIRSHKSYLINIKYISTITGNSNGYKLLIENTNTEIPVSRIKGKEIISQIELIKDSLTAF